MGIVLKYDAWDQLLLLCFFLFLVRGWGSLQIMLLGLNSEEKQASKGTVPVNCFFFDVQENMKSRKDIN